MDFSAIGQKIKDLRKLLGLSQKELAEGICTQAQISKIEKGDVYPYASTLYLISQKLGVDVNYFFHIGTTPRLDYILEVERQLEMTRRSFDYESMRSIIKGEENNPLFTQNPVNRQLIKWHRGIYEYHLNKNPIKAHQILNDAIALTHGKLWTEREIEILLSKGIILFEENELEEALAIYRDAKRFIDSLATLQDVMLMTKLHYNIARVLTRLTRYEESIESCTKGIAWCLEKDHLFLLGELHYHTGYNYELNQNLAEAKEYMEKALLIFELQNDTKYHSYINKKLKTWNFPI
jgi:transcriptional regulator with XRE-family HTH domain